MLSHDTERRLARLLHQTAELERTVERSRQDLSASPDFLPYAAFEALDRLSVRGLSVQDLKAFVNRAGVSVLEENLQLLLQQYDSDSDSRLSLPDFFQLVLPSENAALRERAERRSRLGPLGYAVELALARHIQLEGNAQASLAALKQGLGEVRDFTNIEAFKAIDRQGLGYIGEYALKSFMRRNGVSLLDSDVDGILRRIDTDGDGKLGYSEFCDGIALRAGRGSAGIRASSLHRSFSTYGCSPAKRLSPYRATANPFRENNFYRGTNTVTPYRTYSPYRPSSTLSAYRSSSPLRQASPYRPSSPLRQSSLYKPSSPLRQSSPYRPSSPLRQSSPYRPSSPLRQSSLYKPSSPLRQSSLYKPSSPLRQSSLYRSSSPLRQSNPYRSSSPLRQSNPYRSSSPLRQSSPYRSSSPFRSSSPQRVTQELASSYRSSPQQSPVRTQLFTPSPSKYDLSQIVSTFKSQISLSRDLERAKDSLSLQPDFTVRDFFRLADLADKSFLTCSDLESLLTDLGVAHSPNDIYLLIRHYSSLQDTKLRVSDFQRMLTPKDKSLSQRLSERPALVQLPENRMNIFSRLTMDRASGVMRLFIECERMGEELRKDVHSKRWLNLLEIFRAIDRNADGFITIDEFGDVLREFGVYASEGDLECLVDRYDKNFDGRVSYSEFLQEVTPKLP